MNQLHTSHHSDFDFLQRRWKVSHRQLQQRLVNCSTWIEFDGTVQAMSALGGMGNVDDNVLLHPGGAYHALTLRSFDPASKAWAIWWLDARQAHTLDAPVTGSFHADGVGRFYGQDQVNGKPVQLRFEWHQVNSNAPRWEQACSDDNGATWEVNWRMQFVRAEAA